MTEIPDVNRLLAELRTDLRRGRYERLQEVLPILEIAIGRPQVMDETRIRQLKAEAERTARAAQAALRGLRAGQLRVTELMRLDAGFLSYDAAGAPESAPRLPSLSRQL